MLPPLHPALVVISLAALLGCASERSASETELAEIAEHHESELLRFELDQAGFARRNPMPRNLDFGDGGTIYVSECALRGYPRREAFWLRYTWLNTTGHAVEAVRVMVTLRDPFHGHERRETMELALPFLTPFGRESSYTTFSYLPADGMRFGPDLEWTIGAEAVEHPGGG
jgi:hypothetical protein